MILPKFKRLKVTQTESLTYFRAVEQEVYVHRC